MKTIILCGGRGWRLQEETEFKPKPMVEIGHVPVLIHIMNIYAKFNHKEFYLALGYRGDIIRDYFLHLRDYENDTMLDLKNNKTSILKSKLKLDYKIAFIETGLTSDTAERILKSAKYINDDQFLVSYGDDVSNVNIDKLLAFHKKQVNKHKSLATITAAHPSSHFGKIWADKRDVIRKFDEKPALTDYVNGGFMVFEKKALDHLRKGETLEDGLERMANKKKLSMYRHEGFWHPMNTVKDVQYLNQLWTRGKPWTKF